MPTNNKTEKKEATPANEEQADNVTLSKEQFEKLLAKSIAPPPPPEPVAPDPRQCPQCGQSGALGYLESKDAVVCSFCSYERPLNPGASKSWFQRRREKVEAERAERERQRKQRRSQVSAQFGEGNMNPRTALFSEQQLEVQIALVEQVARMANAMEHIALGLNSDLQEEENDAS